MRIKEFLDIVVRYALILLSSINNLAVFYIIFTPLTVYPVFWILGLFYNTSLSGNTIFIALSSGKIAIELVDACIAGSAYYLLFALNLATKGARIKARIYSMLFTFLAFLLLNILRIIILSALYTNNFAYFDFVHSIFWNLLSTLFVVGIWFLSVKLFKVKEIPAYSDLRFVYKEIIKSRKKKSQKKIKN